MKIMKISKLLLSCSIHHSCHIVMFHFVERNFCHSEYSRSNSFDRLYDYSSKQFFWGNHKVWTKYGLWLMMFENNFRVL